MSGASFILTINLLVAGLFCSAFVLIALYDRQSVSARWFALTYVLGMANLGIEAIVPLFSDAKGPVLFAYLAFLAALLVLNVGIARLYGAEPPRTLLIGILAFSLLIHVLIQDMERQSAWRQFLYQAPYFIMQAVGAGIVLRQRQLRLVDNLLAGVLALSALHFLSKPLLALAFGGVGENPQAYLTTIYALFSQSMGTVLAVATALILMMMLVANILKDVTTKSETDALSGLLNRRGFELRLDAAVRQHVSNGMPVALVICDLDHFKTVNDTYGHAVGDRLIAAFAATLHGSSSSHHVLGRIGGEEFAAILPGSNLPAGRLFAENVRTAFAELTVEGLGSRRSSASFGVAQLMSGEMPAAFLARADAALYEAKRAGRDCVRISRAEQAADDGFAFKK